MKVLKLLICSCILFCTLITVGHSQYISPVWGNSFSVTLSKFPVKYNIPVELLPNVRDSVLMTEILAVKSDKSPNSVPINSFIDSGIVKVNGKYFLVLVISNDNAIIPATYTIDYRIKSKEAPAANPQALPLNIVFNAAEITAVPTVVVGRKDAFLGFPYNITGNRFLLTEQGRKSPMTGINIQVIKTVNPSGLPVPAKVDFNIDRNAIIAPGQSLPVEFDVTGDLPIGKSTTTAVLTSPQLAAPVTITIETTTRHGIAWLIFFILLGLAVGYFTRILLNKKINLSTAKLNAIELIRIIDKEIKNRPDQKFVKTAGSIRQELENALRKSNDAAITALVTSSTAALQAAIATHNSDRVAAQQALDELKATMQQLEKLPPQFNSIANKFESAIKIAQQANDSGDADSSKKIDGFDLLRH